MTPTTTYNRAISTSNIALAVCMYVCMHFICYGFLCMRGMHTCMPTGSYVFVCSSRAGIDYK